MSLSFSEREPNISQNPDEAVALGATIQAGILSGAVRDVVLLDVTPLSLGIETFGGLMNVIIPRNSTIPIKAGEMFTTAVNHQRSMKIKVLQGEREMAADNWTLGEFEIEFEPAPKGVARVGVQFEIDANGILQVLARDTKTGAEKIVALTSAVDVSDEAVEAMIADSLEHAFEDMSERVWTETRLKAEEMLAAVENAFQLAAERISAEERSRIEQAANEVREAMQTHETPRLKAANAALDEATQELAALIVEQAMIASPSPEGSASFQLAVDQNHKLKPRYLTAAAGRSRGKASIVLHSDWHSDHNGCMRSVRGLQWAFVIVALAIGSWPALGEDTNFSRPLVQARFDHLVPTSYPTIRPSFRQLQPTTQPVIHPGIPRIPITKNLVNPFAQPLLIVNERPAPLAAAKTHRTQSPRLAIDARSTSPAKARKDSTGRSEGVEKTLD